MQNSCSCCGPAEGKRPRSRSASAPVYQWTTLVSDAEGWREHNLGRGGTGFLATSTVQGCGLDFCPNYAGMIPEALTAVPAVMVIAGGQNDFSSFVTDPQSVIDAVNATFAAAREAFPELRIISVGPSTPSDVTAEWVAFDAVVRAAAAESGAEYVSLIDRNPDQTFWFCDVGRIASSRQQWVEAQPGEDWAPSSF